MRISLQQLDLQLGSITRRLWPDAQVDVNFSPLLNLDYGDVGSSVAIRLASLLHVKPETIAAQICAEWNPVSHINLEIVNGFINVRFTDAQSDVFEEELYVAHCHQPLAIIVAPFAKPVSRLAELRLCCGALGQLIAARQCGIEACLILNNEKLSSAKGAVYLMHHVLEKLSALTAHETGEIFSSDAVLEACAQSENISLWVAPHALPRAAFVNLCRRIEQRGQRLRVTGPATPWLDFRFHEDRVQDFTSWNDDELLALLWYLAQGIPAADIDFTTGQRSERSNILWFWESTVERVSRLAPSSIGESEGFVPAGDLPALTRRLGLRLAFLRTFYVQAATDGALETFLEAMCDVLITFNRVFNDPAFRIRHAANCLSSAETKIIAGAHRILSDSITLTDFTEGKRYGSHARTPHETNRTIIGDYE